MTQELIISIIAGIGLAAAAGFRIFVPLLVLSVASHFGVVPLNENFAWVGSSAAMISLGVATVLEAGAYLVPWLDHLLDSIAVPLAVVAGTMLMASTLTDMSPALMWALAIIAGGGTATAVQTSTSAARIASTATTGGLANPLVSMVESVMSVIMSLLSVWLPVLAIVLLLIMGWGVFRLFRKKRKRD